MCFFDGWESTGRAHRNTGGMFGGTEKRSEDFYREYRLLGMEKKSG